MGVFLLLVDDMQALLAQRATIIIDQFHQTNQGLFWLLYIYKKERIALPYIAA